MSVRQLCTTSATYPTKTDYANTLENPKLDYNVQSHLVVVASSKKITLLFTHSHGLEGSPRSRSMGKWGSEPILAVLQCQANSCQGRSKLLNLNPFQKSV